MADAPSFFPPPPSRYLHFTTSNLKSATDPGASTSDAPVPADLDLKTLVEPPRLDWLEEGGEWTVFGETYPWPGKEGVTGLQGLPKLYPEGMDRREALQKLLSQLQLNYLSLVSHLATSGPPSLSTNPTPAHSDTISSKMVADMELVCWNMHNLCNELRPQQGRESLKRWCQERAGERRRRADEVRKTCEDMKLQLASLNFQSQPTASPTNQPNIPSSPTLGAPTPVPQVVPSPPKATNKRFRGPTDGMDEWATLLAAVNEM